MVVRENIVYGTTTIQNDTLVGCYSGDFIKKRKRELKQNCKGRKTRQEILDLKLTKIKDIEIRYRKKNKRIAFKICTTMIMIYYLVKTRTKKIKRFEESSVRNFELN